MNRLLLVFVSVFALSGCETVQQVTSSVSNAVGDTLAQFQELQVKDFCAIKASDLETAKRRYSGKTYIFTGTIDTIASSEKGYTVGIQGNGGIIWAQFEEFDTTLKKGDYIGIQGRISPANFNQENRNKCMILLDESFLKE